MSFQLFDIEQLQSQRWLFLLWQFVAGFGTTPERKPFQCVCNDGNVRLGLSRAERGMHSAWSNVKLIELMPERCR